MKDPAASDTPGLTDVIQVAIDGRLGAVHTSMPGVIMAYDATKQRAQVQPTMRGMKYDYESESFTQYKYPVIPDVPVMFPGGAGWSITGPIEVGTPVLLILCERNITEWKYTGAEDNETQFYRRFDLSDAVAIPGIRSFVAPLEATALDASSVVLAAGAGGIKLGSSAAAEFLARADKVDALLTALANVFSAWTPVPNDGGAALKTALTALLTGGWPTSSACSKVKAE